MVQAPACDLGRPFVRGGLKGGGSPVARATALLLARTQLPSPNSVASEVAFALYGGFPIPVPPESSLSIAAMGAGRPLGSPNGVAAHGLGGPTSLQQTPPVQRLSGVARPAARPHTAGRRRAVSPYGAQPESGARHRAKSTRLPGVQRGAGPTCAQEAHRRGSWIATPR
jgi:hypothetical protein